MAYYFDLSSVTIRGLRRNVASTDILILQEILQKLYVIPARGVLSHEETVQTFRFYGIGADD